MSAPRGALRVGDRIRYDGRVHTVIALSGSVVQLVSDSGQGTAVLFTYLVGSEGFELLNTGPVAVELTPFGLLEAVPEPALKRAQFLERHLIEVETGLPPNPDPAAVARPEYDPAWRTLSERIAAKAAELSASGTAISERTLQRMRANWRAQGLWGLVDQRAVRAVGAPGDRADERLVAAVREVLAAQENASTGTRSRVMRQVEQLLSERHGPQEVLIPPRSSFYRLLNSLERNTYSFAAATTRRSQARRPNAPFTPTAAARPGEIIQIDTTPLDVLAILDDGVTGRVELSIAVDVATRTICAGVLRPSGTKAVDAALLLARTLVPEPLRPGWADALRMSASLIPHARLMSIDARLEHAAAKPVIVPETIVIDHGRVFISEVFMSACQTLGISVQPARPATPTDKGVVERTFSSINTLFCQHVAGYVGSNPTRRGSDVAAVWTLRELAELFDEWVIACWQPRPHDSLRSPFLPQQALSPNETYSLLVARTGHLPVCLQGEDYLEFLPVSWRKINDYGVVIDYRTYDCPELGPYRRQPSGVVAKGGLWEVHHDPYDLSHIWIRDKREVGGWITVPWELRDQVSAPFADFTWRHARALLAGRGQDDTNEKAIAAVVEDLLTRAGTAPDRRVIARTRAAAQDPHPVQELRTPDSGSVQEEPAPVGEVVPFGVFDAFTDGTR